LKRVNVLPASYLNVGDVLSHQNLLMTVAAVRQVERLWGGERATRRRAPIPEREAAPQPQPAARARRRRPAVVEAPAPEKPAAAVEKPAPRRRRTAAAETAVAEKPAPRRIRKPPAAKAKTNEENAANA
jgi:hypothetical protein